ncbi:ABC transporter ATP-binding protein [Actinophytocola sp.]|uniref:ABC transporter ATP-binding protein n=1 Tax=Actinophytocola sp. TaxID=1872138 RepID=UPI002D801BFF|nr:ABC transporter ATP-binding protein [Actinophytocola sp.]HET9139931.1 ABC transporter ATP-binding protein [Actinophytocola sp.]
MKTLTQADLAATVRPTTSGSVLECSGLTRRFGDRVAVDGVSVRIAPGETYGLLGPNGAGKTTVIRMVCGLLRPDAGTVVVAGREMRGAGGLRARALVGYVPQDVALYPDLTARENLRFFGRMYRLRGSRLRRRVEEVLELVDLTERAGERVESFSGGMRRRLNIGAGLLHEPTLLVLDEPTVGVDPQSRHAILQSVRRFSRSGMAVLYTTHYMEEAERLCDRVGIIDHGRLIAEGTRGELVAQVAERDRISLVATGDLAAFAAACRDLAGVFGVGTSVPESDAASGTAPGALAGAVTTDGEVHLLADSGRRLLPAVFDLADRRGVTVRSAQVVEPDLESVFLHLTGTALRE